MQSIAERPDYIQAAFNADPTMFVADFEALNDIAKLDAIITRQINEITYLKAQRREDFITAASFIAVMVLGFAAAYATKLI